MNKMDQRNTTKFIIDPSTSAYMHGRTLSYFAYWNTRKGQVKSKKNRRIKRQLNNNHKKYL